MLSSPTTSNWLRTSPLEILITRSCDPSLQEPNYALHIEVANYINNKKANTCVSFVDDNFGERLIGFLKAPGSSDAYSAPREQP